MKFLQYLELSGKLITSGVRNGKFMSPALCCSKQGTLGLKYLPSEAGDILSLQNKLSEEEIEAVFKHLCKPSSKTEYPAIQSLLNRKSKELLERCCPDGESSSFALKLLDVIRRRGHSTDYAAKFLEKTRNYKELGYHEFQAAEKQRLTALNALEFKDFEKAREITTETFKELSVKEKKEFINSLISMEFRSGSPCYVENLPDIAIFKELKELSPKALSSDVYREKAENIYCSILNRLMEQIPRGKSAIPNTPITIRKGSFLDMKPPSVSNLSDIPLKLTNIEGHNVKVGVLPQTKNCMVHNLSENQLVRLEGLLLTDENAVVCTGRIGGKGELKAGIRPGIIVSPKTMQDYLIQAKDDVSSGYGAAKNLFNIQSIFLTKNNNANTYFPDLIRNKLGLSMEEYNARLQALGDIRYLEDVAKKDRELFSAINDIILQEPMFEAIIRPHLEGIYLPERYKISKTIAQFAERYDIPILYSNAAFI